MLMKEQESRGGRRTKASASGRPDWPWYSYPLWYLAYALLWLWAKLCFRFSYAYGPGVKEALRSDEPILLLGNHQSFIDPLFVMVALKARPIRFVVGYFLAHVSKYKILMRALRAIPIQQFTPDPVALRQILYALKNKERVLLFPEGQRSIDGSTCPMDFAILKVATKADACVITVKLSGAYQAWPRWLQGPHRRGKVEARLEVLARATEWPDRDRIAWRQAFLDRLAYNDPAWADANKLRYRSRWALQGLDLVLHACPACGRPEVMKAEGWWLKCQTCGASYQFTPNYLLSASQVPQPVPQFKPSSIVDWHQWQIQEEGRTWQIFKESLPVTYEDVGPNAEKFANGKESGYLYFNGPACYLASAGHNLRLPLRPGNLLMFSQGAYIQVTCQDKLLRIYPQYPQQVIRLVDLSLYLHAVHAKHKNT